MLKSDFSLFEETPHLVRVSSKMKWSVSEQCRIYQIFCGVSLNSRASPILFFLCSNKTHMDVFRKNYIFNTNIIEGNLACIKNDKLQLGYYDYRS